MGDQHDREVAVAVESVDQAQDLGLHRDVERGGRLVGDQHVGLERERHRDHHALAHPAGELVGVAAHPALGIRDPDRAQQLDRAVVRLRLGTSRCARIISAIWSPTR